MGKTESKKHTIQFQGSKDLCFQTKSSEINISNLGMKGKKSLINYTYSKNGLK
jgi:hypothetical protein